MDFAGQQLKAYIGCAINFINWVSADDYHPELSARDSGNPTEVGPVVPCDESPRTSNDASHHNSSNADENAKVPA